MAKQLYPEVKKATLGPWMQEGERQAKMKKERDDIRKGLRKSSIQIGLAISLPVTIGILFGQYTLTNNLTANTGALIFILIAVGILLLLLVFILFRYVFMTFQNYSLRALPITLTTLGSIFFVTQRVFNLFNGLIGGLRGYAVGLLSLIVIGIIITSISIFAWTSPKIHPLLKGLILVVFLVVAATIGFLA
jgi:hypothetical protein